MDVNVRRLREMPLGHLLREREAALPALWDALDVNSPEAMEDSRYVDANFELSVREQMCDAAARLCRGSG